MDDIYNIIGKVLSGEASSEEQKFLGTWLEQSDENRELYKNLELGWNGVSLVSTSEDKSRVLNRIKNRINDEQNIDTKKTRILFSSAWYRSVASILLLVSIGMLGWFQLSDPFSFVNTLGYQVSECEAGQQKNIQLADGSIVYLNGDSKLKFKTDFEESVRKVFMQGEAFFDVARNEKKPFVIGLEKADVKVLGTSFNIKAYPEDNSLETSVLTGKVAFTYHSHFFNYNEDKHVDLISGQKGVINHSNETLISRTVDNQIDVAWMNRELNFENTNLVELTKSLYRMYGVRFKLTDDSLKDLNFTAKFKNEKIEEVMKILEMTSEFSYKIDENSIFLGKKGEL